MSGGSMDYICYRIDDIADMLEDKEMIELAKDFANLLHDCEWYHSSDIGRNDYFDAVDEFKNKWFKSERKERLINYINDIFDNAKKQCFELIGE